MNNFIRKRLTAKFNDFKFSLPAFSKAFQITVTNILHFAVKVMKASTTLIKDGIRNAQSLKPIFVCVCGSGRQAADVPRQYTALPHQHRLQRSAHRRHVAVVSASTSGFRCRLHVCLRRVPRRHPASAALPAGINGAAFDARRRQCPRTE